MTNYSLQQYRLLFFLLFSFSFYCTSLMAEERIVSPEDDLTAILVDEVVDGDVLVFEPGNYQLNLELNKNVDIKSRDTTNTIFEALDALKPIIRVTGNRSLSIRNVTFSGENTGIQIADGNTNIVITNNVFDQLNIGIEAGDVSSVKVDNNTFYRNVNAISSESFDINLTAYQNIFFLNSEEFENLSIANISYNCFSDDVSSITGVNGNIQRSILLVADDAADFHLKEDSGCIDEGEENEDFDSTLSDLGAFGGTSADKTPNSVVIDSVDVDETYQAVIRWQENLDYRVSGYKVYFDSNPLKGLDSDIEREDISVVDVTDSLEASITDLEVSAESPASPELLSVDVRNEKLIVTWRESDTVTAYTLYYQVVSEENNSIVANDDEAVKSVDLERVNTYTIQDLSNEFTYEVWIVAHHQNAYYFQVAAYIQPDVSDIQYESSFVFDDYEITVGEQLSSGESNRLRGQPEKAVAFPNLPDEGCFIATAAFGHYDDKDVQLLRDFRDQYLLISTAGRSFVNWYYVTGPHAAVYINESEWLKVFVRAALFPIIATIKILNMGLIYFSLLIVVLGLLVLYMARYFAAPRGAFKLTSSSPFKSKIHNKLVS